MDAVVLHQSDFYARKWWRTLMWPVGEKLLTDVAERRGEKFDPYSFGIGSLPDRIPTFLGSRTLLYHFVGMGVSVCARCANDPTFIWQLVDKLVEVKAIRLEDEEAAKLLATCQCLYNRHDEPEATAPEPEPELPKAEPCIQAPMLDAEPEQEHVTFEVEIPVPTSRENFAEKMRASGASDDMIKVATALLDALNDVLIGENVQLVVKVNGA